MPGPSLHRVDRGDSPDGHDLRMPLLGLAAWLGGLAAYLLPGRGVTALAVGGLVAGVLVRRRLAPGARRLLLAGALVWGAVVLSTLLRQHAVASGPLVALAEERAVAGLTATVVSDPRPVEGAWGDQVVVRLRVAQVTARGATHRLGATVLLLGGEEWRAVALGEVVGVHGRLAAADDPDLAALVTGPRAPVRIRGPDAWWRAAAAVRASIRASVAHRPVAQRELVPSLVVGDDAGLPASVEQDFRTTGLTHLTAVSGTNLTLVVGALLLLARTVGVRGRWLYGVGVLGIVGFVLLARTEPSVLRAAAMGAVGLFALGTDGRRRGLRALGVAVVGLVLVHPPLAVSPGFALSVLATAGIVLLAPTLTRALGHWLPLPAAVAVAVPFAAQLACTPVVAALSGEVSLVAVAANVVVAPAVGPATVLGLAGGLVGLLAEPAGRALGTVAAWCVAWIVLVAERGATLPSAAIGWGTQAPAIALLVVLCAVVAVLAPRALARPRVGGAVAVLLLLAVVGVPGRVASWVDRWPPRGWVLVACDVGQGDALALRVAEGSAIVVDAGPDPRSVDRCLDRLGVSHVPLVVLTHFHADHVDGLAGVLQGRRVGGVEASPVLDPPWAADDVRRLAQRAAVPLGIAPYGVTRRYGPVTLQVVWPPIGEPVPGAGDGTSANDSSLVLLVEVRGLSLLLTGDVEPPGQARLAAALPDLDVDVLKVPHHGSAHQDEAWLDSLESELAVVSAGEDNDYGHPDPGLLEHLAAGGTEVGRTDRDGDVAVVVEDSRARLAAGG